MKNRCTWPGDDPLYIKYHDEEWGVPIHEDRILYEFLILEGMQAGLSWITILRKRENFREAFDNFDAEVIARYDENKINELLQNKGIIRNKRKILAAINNAKAYLNVKEEFGSFDSYIWQFTDRRVIKNSWQTEAEIPASTPESETMSKDLKQRGFKFVGPIICYSHMQATGMVNDHIVSCFRYEQV